MHGRMKPKNSDDALHIAAFEGDLDKIRYLIVERGAVMTGAGRFETMPGGGRRGRPTAVGNSTMVIGPSVRWREGNIAEQIAGTHNFYLTPEFWRDNVQE